MNSNLIQGDALTELQKLDSESVDCCITSPPYWALRDYKVDGQLGLEPTIDEYINKLVTIFDQVKRVLKRTGSCWVVIGDTYGRGDRIGNTKQTIEHNPNRHLSLNHVTGYSKSLCMIPERFSIKMIDHGWILRNKIIWYKPNCMPSSAKDRFTVDWEYVYFFTKSQRYYFETQYEPLESDHNMKPHGSRDKHLVGYYPPDPTRKYNPYTLQWKDPNRVWGSTLGRIKRCVWKISTKPFADAHFAVFPPQLIEPMIKAGSPQYTCNKCGHMRKLLYEETRLNTRPGLDTGNGKSGTQQDPNNELHNSDLSKYRQQIVRFPRIGGIKHVNAGTNPTYSGNEWNPSIKQPTPQTTDCNCNAGWSDSTVLDPFMGAGTTGMVALQNARNFIGIELNPEYVAMAAKRLEPWLKQERLITV